LIKDNHRLACSSKMSLQEMVKRAKKITKKPVEVEVDNLREFREVLKARPHIILLDNMTLRQIKRAVMLTKRVKKGGRPALEVSGRINLKNVRSIAKTGVERISIGALTHTLKAIDISLELIRS